MSSLVSNADGQHLSGCNCPICTGSSEDGQAAPATAPTFDAIAGAPGAIDPLLNQTPAYYWNGGQFGTGVTITYSFMNAAPTYYSGVGLDYITSTFTPFTTNEMNAARSVLASWAEVANINFVEVPYSQGSYAQIQFGNCYPGAGIGGFAFYPNSWAGGGDVFLSNASATNLNPTSGSWGYLSLLHEIGHALGLKHPGNYNAGGGGTLGPYLPAGQDNHQHTVMAYSGHPEIFGISPITPMLNDIAAIQFVYGARLTTRTGDDTYSFSNGTEIRAIWDAGGADTIDASNQLMACEIDLEPGHYSSIGTAGRFLHNIAIAQNCWIENATGGWGNDVIRGNALNNVLSGGAGNDSLVGGLGADTMRGGLGNDTFQVDNTSDVVVENANEGTDTVISSVSFTLSSDVENLTMTGVGVGVGNILANVFVAYGGAKTLYGLDGNDNLTAFGNNNVLLGGDGADGVGINGTSNFLLGEAGNDWVGVTGDTNHLIGGLGDDYILVYGNGNTLDGGEDNDNLTAFGSNNNLIGGAGADGVGINGTYNRLDGGDGADWVGVTGDANTLMGGAGDDYILEYGHANRLEGGDGNDNLTDFGNNNVLLGGAGADGVGINGNANNLDGGDGADWVGCTGQGNILAGGADDDYILVVGNTNTLSGSSGNDRLVAYGASTGNVLSGGTGADRFSLAGSGHNTVTDFSIAQGDVLDLAGSGVTSLAGLTLSQAGANTVISFNGAAHITLNSILASDLTASQFAFI